MSHRGKNKEKKKRSIIFFRDSIKLAEYRGLFKCQLKVQAK